MHVKIPITPIDCLLISMTDSEFDVKFALYLRLSIFLCICKKLKNMLKNGFLRVEHLGEAFKNNENLHRSILQQTVLPGQQK